MTVYDQSGAYNLTCNDFHSVYVGKTGRKHDVRLAEHIATYLKSDSQMFAVAKHFLETGHQPKNVTVEFLQVKRSFSRRAVLEYVEILKHSKNGKVFLLNLFIPESALIENVFCSFRSFCRL